MDYNKLKKLYDETLDLLIEGPKTPDQREQYIYAMGHEPNEYWNYDDHIDNVERSWGQILEDQNEEDYPQLYEYLLEVRENIDEINSQIIRDWYYGCRKFLANKNQSKSKEELVRIAKACGIKKAKTLTKDQLINQIKEILSSNYLLQLKENNFNKILPKLVEVNPFIF